MWNACSFMLNFSCKFLEHRDKVVNEHRQWDDFEGTGPIYIERANLHLFSVCLVNFRVEM